MARSLGYTAFQLFLFNPRSWSGNEIPDDAIREFSFMFKESGIKADAHIPYLCNPSSANDEVYKKSRVMLIQNARISKMLNIPLVIHMGSHLGKGFSYSFERLTALLGSVIDETNTEILLENSAGYNNSVGSKLSELAAVISSLGSSHIGVCLDTAHAFAAGYNIATIEGIDSFVKEIDSTIGINSIKLFHLNDSKYELNSGLDRHWHIGKGYIGTKGFTNLLSHKYFSKGSFIMETPVNEEGSEIQNMNAALNIFENILKLKRLKNK